MSIDDVHMQIVFKWVRIMLRKDFQNVLASYLTESESNVVLSSETRTWVWWAVIKVLACVPRHLLLLLPLLLLLADTEDKDTTSGFGKGKLQCRSVAEVEGHSSLLSLLSSIPLFLITIGLRVSCLFVQRSKPKAAGPYFGILARKAKPSKLLPLHSSQK